VQNTGLRKRCSELEEQNKIPFHLPTVALASK
jgi:hypothetical protein